MSNVQITNGTIKYGRTIKTGDFEGKRGDVELSFNIPEGEDAHEAVERVHETVKHHLHLILGHDEDTPDRARPPKPAKETRTTKKLPAAAKEETKSAETVDEPKDPAFLAKELAEKKAAEAKAGEIVDNDPLGLGDLMGEGEPAKEITDKELTDATQKCQSRAKNAPAIRKALNELGIKTPPGRIIDLPQEKRQEYLNKLDAIKPLA
jgi:hypothetical protein